MVDLRQIMAFSFVVRGHFDQAERGSGWMCVGEGRRRTREERSEEREYLGGVLWNPAGGQKQMRGWYDFGDLMQLLAAGREIEQYSFCMEDGGRSTEDAL